MNYIESITDFFKSPKWMMNLLFGGICMFIPAIGPIVLMGWLITGFWARTDENMETFPDFDFGNFVKYLERGLWPFLVMLAASFGLMILFFILAGIPSFIVSMIIGDNGSGFLGFIFSMVLLCINTVLMVSVHLLLTPLLIRASILQDFMTSYDLPFIKKFISLTWLETLLSGLFIFVAGAVLSGLGLIALCVGIYFASALIYFGWAHLGKQLYKLYLSRGGEAIPLSPKLTDVATPSVM